MDSANVTFDNPNQCSHPQKVSRK